LGSFGAGFSFALALASSCMRVILSRLDILRGIRLAYPGGRGARGEGGARRGTMASG
jgi:hypothetical protein